MALKHSYTWGILKKYYVTEYLDLQQYSKFWKLAQLSKYMAGYIYCPDGWNVLYGFWVI